MDLAIEEIVVVGLISFLAWALAWRAGWWL